MSSSETQPGSERQPTQPARRLIRTRRGRLIGGVCSGLGAHFGVDPILFRIAFAGLAIFAGAGVWVYLAILLLVPEEGASRPPIRLPGSSWRSVAGAVAVIVAASLLLPVASRAALGSAWGVGVALGAVALVGAVATVIGRRLREAPAPGRPSADRRLARFAALAVAAAAAATLTAAAGAALAGTHRNAAAWAVLAIGAALAVGAFTGARWLLLPGLAFALAATIFAAARVDLYGGLGERSYRPLAVRELHPAYRLGAGRLEVDLRRLSLPAGETSLRVRVGVGELVVVVPEGVCVATRARVGGGFVGALDRQTGGLDVDWANRPSPPASVPRLALDGRVGMGALFVVDRPLKGGFQLGAYGTDDACRGGSEVPR